MVYTKDLLKFSKELRVLYVEDDENVRKQTALLLENLFGSVETACDGLEGLDKYNNDNYDIVVTDIRMPKLDGIEMSENIKESNPNQAIIVTSAHNDSEILIDLIDIGIDGFTIKPFDTDKLIKTIYKVSKTIYQQKELQMYKNRLEEMVDTKTHMLQEMIDTLEGELKDKDIKIENLNSILKEQIYIDQLTGIYNNKKLDIEIKDKKTLVDEVDGEFSLIILDIKNFAQINEKLNRVEANKVIQEFVLILGKCLDEYDELFRYGGVEFVIITEDSKEDLENKCKHIESVIAEYKFYNNIDLEIIYATSTYTKNSDLCLIQDAGEKLSQLKKNF
jgi:diguanylate cyclase (GGDEF)-like protein